MQAKIKNILKYFPENIEKTLLSEISENFDKLEEIRIRTLRPIILKFKDDEKVIKYEVSTEDILNTLSKICENSIYSYQNEIASRIYNCKRWS